MYTDTCVYIYIYIHNWAATQGGEACGSISVVGLFRDVLQCLGQLALCMQVRAYYRTIDGKSIISVYMCCTPAQMCAHESSNM